MAKPPKVLVDLQGLLQAVADVEKVLRRGAIVQATITLLQELSTGLKQLSSKGPTVDSKEIETFAKQMDSAASALGVAVAAANAPTGPGYTSPMRTPGGAPPKGN